MYRPGMQCSVTYIIFHPDHMQLMHNLLHNSYTCSVSGEELRQFNMVSRGVGAGGLHTPPPPPQYLTSNIIPSSPVNLQIGEKIQDQPFSLDTNVTTEVINNKFLDTVKSQLVTLGHSKVSTTDLGSTVISAEHVVW